ncbi:thymidine kinase 2, mitochondrial-like isoform X2 [Lineus longissimus]|uniref:thymidine kinase 2, mitochondrial-like isoform X2 n=1 Tax=Lineus longissimus TaxID=88925 RepID=UPI00315DAC08
MIGICSDRKWDDADCLALLRQITKPRQSKFTVSVEGNIGSGKSTLLKYFKDSPFVEAIQEPVDQWTNLKGHNALELLYKDTARWTFSFNNYAQLTRLKMHLKKTRKSVKMLERSLYSTRHVFVENNYRSGCITGLEYSVLSEWYEWIIANQDVKVDLFVYLKADPETCYERIKQRARKEESTVPLSFIKELHDLHEKWLIEQSLGKLPAPVLVLDANIEMPKMTDVYETHKREILCGYC